MHSCDYSFVVFGLIGEQIFNLASVDLLLVEVSRLLKFIQFSIGGDILSTAFNVFTEGVDSILDFLQFVVKENFLLAQKFVGKFLQIWQAFFFSLGDFHLLFVGGDVTK